MVAVCDWNEDGQRDLIAGDCDGYTTLFLETGDGLHNAGHIQRDSSGVNVDIKVSANSYPCIHDWNEDGNKDLIIGEIEHVLPDTGNIRIYLNTGTNAVPLFRSYQLMQAGGGHLKVVHAHPVLVDLDRDSLKDLVCGNENGFIYFFKNRATNQAPYFEAAYETLMTTDSVFLDGYTNSRTHYTDWTGDGDLDLIMGGQDGYVWLCENATFTGITTDSAVVLSPAWIRILSNPVRDVAEFSGVSSPGAVVGFSVYTVSGCLIHQKMLTARSDHGRVFQWKIPVSLPSGMYIAVFKAGCAVSTQKVVVTR